MRLDILAKDRNSNPTGCKTVYLAEDGRFGIQGDEVDDDTRANLENVLPGEQAVLIEAEIVIEAVQRYLERMS